MFGPAQRRVARGRLRDAGEDDGHGSEDRCQFGAQWCAAVITLLFVKISPGHDLLKLRIHLRGAIIVQFEHRPVLTNAKQVDAI